jgi:hypothetical protein
MLFHLISKSLVSFFGKFVGKGKKQTDCQCFSLRPRVFTPFRFIPSVLMHFLFLYFRFFITYFPFLIKNLVSLSLPLPVSTPALKSLCFGTFWK